MFPRTNSKIPTGLVVGGPSASFYSGIAEAVFQHVKTVEEAMVIHLDSTQAPNLKSVLKLINRQAADQSSKNGDANRYLNYDLQLLCDHVQATSIKKVVIFFTDSESFQENLLAELIDVLRYCQLPNTFAITHRSSSWIDRIPFVVLFSIATSIELFEDRLAQSTIKILEGTRFDLAQVDIDVLFKATMALNQPRSILLGPGLSSTILQRDKDLVQSSSDFLRTMKVLCID